MQASLIKWKTKLAVGWFKFYNHYLHMKWINHLVMLVEVVYSIILKLNNLLNFDITKTCQYNYRLRETNRTNALFLCCRSNRIIQGCRIIDYRGKNNISVHILHMLWLNTNQKAPVFVCMLNVIYVNITYKIYLYTFMYILKQ